MKKAIIIFSSIMVLVLVSMQININTPDNNLAEEEIVTIDVKEASANYTEKKIALLQRAGTQRVLIQIVVVV